MLRLLLGLRLSLLLLLLALAGEGLRGAELCQHRGGHEEAEQKGKREELHGCRACSGPRLAKSCEASFRAARPYRLGEPCEASLNQTRSEGQAWGAPTSIIFRTHMRFARQHAKQGKPMHQHGFLCGAPYFCILQALLAYMILVAASALVLPTVPAQVVQPLADPGQNVQRLQLVAAPRLDALAFSRMLNSASAACVPLNASRSDPYTRVASMTPITPATSTSHTLLLKCRLL